ncbi:MAG TPA: zf-HC2 domain-containing protein [Anaeromyxobacter sp.]
MTCRDYDVLVSLHAAGALDAAETARVEAHLAGCAACRAEAGELAAALSLAALPPASEAERRALADLPGRTIATLRRSERRRSFAKRVAVGFAAAAAAAALVLAPAVVRKSAPAPAGEAAVAWRQPDLDALWNDASVLDLDSFTLADGSDAAQGADETDTDAALAALDI